MAKDMLFATLDPTMRAVNLDNGLDIILSDTVGFISDLPTELVAAFRATLEEVLAADVILHVRDISHEVTEDQAHDVRMILDGLGVRKQIAQLEVWNKIDQMRAENAEAMRSRAARDDGVLTLSALTGEGVDELLQVLDKTLRDASHKSQLSLTFDQGKQRAWLFAQDLIETETQSDNGFEVSVTWTAKQEKQFNAL